MTTRPDPSGIPTPADVLDAPDMPGRDVFVELSRNHRIVPVWRELVSDTVTPVGAFLRVVEDRNGFLFESVEGGERWGRYSFVGFNPLATFTTRGREVTVTGSLTPPEEVSSRSSEGVLSTIEALLSCYRSPVLPGLPPLHGGLVGYLGYDVVREVERLPNVPPDDLGFPDSVLQVIGQLCAFDHWRQRVVLLENVVIGETWSDDEASWAYRTATARLDAMAEDLFKPLDAPPIAAPVPGEPLPEVRRSMSSEQFMNAVDVAKDLITAGDIFQVVLSQRFDLDLDADPFDLYRELRLVNPSPYLYFLRTDSCTVVGSSPEPMVRLRDGVVVSRPIAGTRRRGATESEDARLAAELSEHPKEVAEHVMLVDLARNDVGRVVRYGSEHMDEFMTLERYSHVMHLTSQVSGSLAEGKGPVDVLRATLPAGTLSGAPKVRAMEIIDDLEPTKRGVYGGVIGYFDFSGNLDTAITIRTMTVDPSGRASVQAGAGIVADSEAAEEDIECVNKAKALLATVPYARRATRSRNSRKGNGAGLTAGVETAPESRTMEPSASSARGLSGQGTLTGER
jgi:anthranilate synthase component I